MTLKPEAILSVSAEYDDQVTVMHVVGEIDRFSVPVLKEALVDELQRFKDRGQKPSIVVDLSRVSFVDAGGHWVLINGSKTAESLQGTLVLVPSPHVTRTFKIAGLDKLFRFFPSAEEARVALAG